MEDGGWWRNMEDGGRMLMEDRGWMMEEDGGWVVGNDGEWRTEYGGCRMADGR